MFLLYRELHNVSGVETLTASKVTLKLFTVNFLAIFIKGIIYNDLIIDRLLRKLLPYRKNFALRKLQWITYSLSMLLVNFHEFWSNIKASIK